MLDFIMVPLVVGIVTLGIYKLFELFVCKKERLALIDKMGDRVDASFLKEKVYISNVRLPNFSFSALKGGCLLMGIGLGLFIAFVVSVYSIPNYWSNDSWSVRNVISVIYGACVLFFGGVGLITAFVIEMRIGKNDKKNVY